MIMYFFKWCFALELGEVWVKASQSCPTLCNPMDCTVPGILQARILEWVPFPFCRGSSQPRDWTQVSGIAGTFFTSWAIREVHGWVKSLSRVRLFATPWIVAYQAPPSMGFSGKNTGVGRHFLLQGIFPTLGSNLGFLHCRWILYHLYHLSHQGSPLSQ